MLLTYEQLKEEGLLEAIFAFKKDTNEKVKSLFLEKIFPLLVKNFAPQN